MAYTTYTEIEADFKNITFASSGSSIIQSEVTQFIVESDALINSYVGSRYSIPVTSGDGLNLLKLLSRSLVSARIKRILEVKQEKQTDANQSVTGVLLSPTAVIKILENIRDDKLNLDGAISLVSSNGFYSNNYSNDVEPVIKKDEKQW